MSEYLGTKMEQRWHPGYAKMLLESCSIFHAIRYTTAFGNQWDPDIIARVPEPTTAPPGSPEKIEVMRRRVENGEHLFSPDDAHDYTGQPYVRRSMHYGD